MPAKLGERLGGLFLFVVGTGITVWMWHLALTTGDYNEWAGTIFPAFAVLGLSLLLFPGQLSDLQEKGGADEIEQSNLPFYIWTVIFVLMLACGVSDYILLRVFAKEVTPETPIAAEVQPAPVQEEPHEAPPTGWRGGLVLLGGLLTIVGIVVAMVGLVWHHGSEFLSFFSAKANPERALRVAIIGCLMMAAGIGMVFLAR
jgi:hypothetical protein